MTNEHQSADLNEELTLEEADIESEDQATEQVAEQVEDLEAEQIAELEEELETGQVEDLPDTDYTEPTMDSVVEAILFASDEPLTVQRLVNIVEAGGVREIRKCIDDLNKKYKKNGSAFTIEQIAGGYQMMTLGIYNHWLKKLLRARTETKLTQAGLETLAIISYKQPIIRADIEAIRGVGSGEMIRSLMYKGLVKIVGRAEVLGRPMLYGTTKKFLEIFGLNTLKDLPKIEELKEPK